MISFIQYLIEAFDKPARTISKGNDGYTFWYRFSINGRGYKSRYETRANMMEISFESDDGSYFLTGYNKDQFQIFATLKAQLREMLDLRPDTYLIEFSAFDSKAFPLYQRLGQKIATELGGQVYYDKPYVKVRLK